MPGSISLHHVDRQVLSRPTERGIKKMRAVGIMEGMETETRIHNKARTKDTEMGAVNLRIKATTTTTRIKTKTRAKTKGKGSPPEMGRVKAIIMVGKSQSKIKTRIRKSARNSLAQPPRRSGHTPARRRRHFRHRPWQHHRLRRNLRMFQRLKLNRRVRRSQISLLQQLVYSAPPKKRTRFRPRLPLQSRRLRRLSLPLLHPRRSRAQW